MASTLQFVNLGVRAQSNGATSVNPALPASRVNGNVMVAVCISKNNDTHTWSGTGWNKIDQQNSGASFTASIAYCIVNGSEQSPTISWTNSAACGGQAAHYTANDPVSAIGTNTFNTGSTSTHTCNGITTTRNFSGVLYIEGAGANTALAQPAGFAEDGDGGSGTGAYRTVFGHADSNAGVGWTSPNISVTGANAAWVMWQLEILTPIIAARSLTQPVAREPFAQLIANGGGIAPSIPAGLKSERGRVGPALRALMRFERPSITDGEQPGRVPQAAAPPSFKAAWASQANVVIQSGARTA